MFQITKTLPGLYDKTSNQPLLYTHIRTGWANLKYVFFFFFESKKQCAYDTIYARFYNWFEKCLWNGSLASRLVFEILAFRKISKNKSKNLILTHSQVAPNLYNFLLSLREKSQCFYCDASIFFFAEILKYKLKFSSSWKLRPNTKFQ